MALPLLVSVLLGGGASQLARRLPPATVVRMLTTAMLVSALATGFVLSVAALLGLAQIPEVAAVGHWSPHVLDAKPPVSTAVGSLAAVTACGLMLAALRRAAVSGQALLRAALACRRMGRAHAGGLVVVDDDLPDAYALPGLGGRVVVSTAMLRALRADERRVLLAHEAAHLRHRHHLWVLVAELAASANPLLRPAARVVRAAVERWADEVAAVEVGDRPLAARALARAGLTRATARRQAATGTALAAVDDGVADRARALLADPPPRRRMLEAGVGVLVVAAAAAVLVTAVDANARFEAAEHAYCTALGCVTGPR